MVAHLPGFIPFCGMLEFLFFYHVYSITRKEPLQYLFTFFRATLLFCQYL